MVAYTVSEGAEPAWVRKSKKRPPMSLIEVTRFGKFEKLGSGDDTDGVAANVFQPRVAAAVPIKARHRVHRAGVKRLAEHVAG
jgi:hypothetical protein